MKKQITGLLVYLRNFCMLMILMLSLTAIFSIAACSDDKDEPTSPNTTTEEVEGQTIRVNDQTCNVSDQSYASTYNKTFWSPSSITLQFSKDGCNDVNILSIVWDDVFIPYDYNSGEALNITKQSSCGLIVYNEAKFDSKELAYRSGKITYQGYDSANNLVLLKFDRVAFADQNTSELFVFDGLVKIKYKLDGYTDTIAVNNENYYVSDCTVVNEDGHFSMGFTLFKWHSGSSKSEFTFRWREIDGTFNPDNMRMGDAIDVRSSDSVLDEQSYIGVNDKFKHALTLESGIFTFKEYDSAIGISLLQLDNMTFTAEDNQTFVLNGTIKLKDQNIYK